MTLDIHRRIGAGNPPGMPEPTRNATGWEDVRRVYRTRAKYGAHDYLLLFGSWGAMLDYAERAERTGRTNESHRSSKWTEWVGTQTWEECITLARTGWPEGEQYVASLRDRYLSKVRGRHDLQQVPAMHTDLAGSFPNVPGYLAGTPDAMYSWDPVHVPRPIVYMTVSVGATGDVDATNMRRRGAAACALVDLFEAAGMRVHVDLVSAVEGTQQGHANETIDVRATIKRPDRYMHPSVMAFALAHESTLRRIVFSIRERLPAAEQAYYRLSGGYGRSWDAPEGTLGDVMVPAFRGSSQWSSDENVDDWLEAVLLEQGLIDKDGE